MSDGQYLEADGEHTAGGRRMAAYERERCAAFLLAGFSNVFECALPDGHDDSHESQGGSSWMDACGDVSPDDLAYGCQRPRGHTNLHRRGDVEWTTVQASPSQETGDRRG